MATFSIFYSPNRMGGAGEEEFLGKFKGQQEADDFLKDDMQRRTGLAQEVIEKVLIAFGHYQIYKTDFTGEDADEAIDRGLFRAAQRAALTE